MGLSATVILSFPSAASPTFCFSHLSALPLPPASIYPPRTSSPPVVASNAFQSLSRLFNPYSWISRDSISFFFTHCNATSVPTLFLCFLYSSFFFSNSYPLSLSASCTLYVFILPFMPKGIPVLVPKQYNV